MMPLSSSSSSSPQSLVLTILEPIKIMFDLALPMTDPTKRTNKLKEVPLRYLPQFQIILKENAATAESALTSWLSRQENKELQALVKDLLLTEIYIYRNQTTTEQPHYKTVAEAIVRELTRCSTLDIDESKAFLSLLLPIHKNRIEDIIFRKCNIQEQKRFRQLIIAYCNAKSFTLTEVQTKYIDHLLTLSRPSHQIGLSLYHPPILTVAPTAPTIPVTVAHPDVAASNPPPVPAEIGGSAASSPFPAYIQPIAPTASRTYSDYATHTSVLPTISGEVKRAAGATLLSGNIQTENGWRTVKDMMHVLSLQYDKANSPDKEKYYMQLQSMIKLLKQHAEEVIPPLYTHLRLCVDERLTIVNDSTLFQNLEDLQALSEFLLEEAQNMGMTLHELYKRLPATQKTELIRLLQDCSNPYITTIVAGATPMSEAIQTLTSITESIPGASTLAGSTSSAPSLKFKPFGCVS